MKFLRSCFLGALLCTAPAALKASVAGNYQALLYSEAGDLGSPVALVTTTVNTKGTLSGKLTTKDKKVYSFKTKTPLAFEEGNEATTEDIIINRGKGIASLTLRMTFFDSEEGAYFHTDLLMEDESIGGTENGLPIFVFGKGEPAAFTGSYTLALENATEPGEDEPAGSGYAIGKADAKGMLKLVGKTGDGISFTAALPASEQQQFFMFINPYKRDGCFLAGKLKLGLREDELFNMLPAETGYDLHWKKAAGAKDKSYRNGFGPLDVLVSMEPWTVPAKGETIADLFGISSLEIFDIGYDGVFPGTAYTKYVPIKAGLTAKNTLRIAAGGAGSTFGFDPSLWAKVITTKIDPKTGKFTATLNIEDIIEPTTPTGKSKLVKRKVAFEGVLLRPAQGSVAPIAQGQIIVPPKDVKTDTTTSSMFAFSGNIVEDAIYVAAAATAGTYKGVIIRQPNEPEDPQDVMIPYATGTPGPPAGANITFTISPDLQTLTFQGRVLKLVNDGRGTNNIITYNDLPEKISNSCLVHLQVHGTTKRVIGIFATYNQFVRSGFSVVTRVSTFLQLDNSIIKQ